MGKRGQARETRCQNCGAIFKYYSDATNVKWCSKLCAKQAEAGRARMRKYGVLADPALMHAVPDEHTIPLYVIAAQGVISRHRRMSARFLSGKN